jgi:hypothetical protein
MAVDHGGVVAMLELLHPPVGAVPGRRVTAKPALRQAVLLEQSRTW